MKAGIRRTQPSRKTPRPAQLRRRTPDRVRATLPPVPPACGSGHEEHILHLNRMLATLSEVNQIIVRAHDRDTLFRDICTATVIRGKFSIAWIGVPDAERRWVVPVACAGIDMKELRTHKVSMRDEPEGQGPMGTAMRTGTLAICNDILKDPQAKAWHTEAVQLGFNACAGVPLVCGGAVVACLGVYVPEKDFFDEEEEGLLKEIGADISFSLESQEREVKRRLLETRIERINQGLLSLGVDPVKNITQLTGLCGELLDATGAVYTRLSDGMLHITGHWHTHDDLPATNRAAGHICHDLIQGGSDEVTVIRNLQATSYAQTAPCVRAHGLHTYLGKPIAFSGRRSGILCVFFADDRVFTDIDLKVVSIVASAIGAEEARLTVADALRRERDRSQRYLDTAGVIMVALDREGRVTLINRKGCDMLGWSEQELLGADWFETCVPPQVRMDVRQTFYQLQDGKMDLVEYFENELLTKSGECRPFAFFNALLRDDAGAVCGTLSSGEDLTERRRIEHEREVLQNQLLQAQKMDAIGTLAGGIAHDFNNVLTTISGYADLALRTLAPGQTAHADVTQISHAAEHAAALTRQLLMFSRKQTVRPMPLDINTAVQNVLRMMSRVIGEHIRMEVLLDSAVRTVRADASNVEQVILNLAVNARDAMPNGGTLLISTANVSVTPADCHGKIDAQPGEFVRLTVADTGMGIPPDIVPRIFEPFFTTKESGKGTGMGLSVVYGIVKQHRGWLDVQSELGKGSAFHVYMPVHADVLNRTAGGMPSVLEELQGDGTRVLLVEDDAGVRKYAARVLRQNGYDVVEAGTGREACELFSQGAPFALLFSDVILPDANGLVLADELVERAPDMRVVLTSGYTDRMMDMGKYGGARKFLHKPYSALELLRALKTVGGG